MKSFKKFVFLVSRKIRVVTAVMLCALLIDLFVYCSHRNIVLAVYAIDINAARRDLCCSPSTERSSTN